MIVSGNVPESIVYYFSGDIVNRFKFDDDNDSKSGTNTNVTPAFCSDATNTKTRETGERWAKSYQCGFKEGMIVNHIEKKNVPISNIQIIGLEHRGNGGRAYKVIADGYYFDLREDILLDILMHSSVSNGIIKCDLIWCKVASEMKLVRVGSDIHNALIKVTEVKKRGKIKMSDLVPNTVYKDIKGVEFIYLGRCSVTDVYGHYNNSDYEHLDYTGPCFLKLHPVYMKDYLSGKLLNGYQNYIRNYISFSKTKPLYSVSDTPSLISIEKAAKYLINCNNYKNFKIL